MLSLYRRALRLRRAEFPPDAPMTWLPAPSGVLAFTRGPVTCIANLSPSPIPLPAADILLTSAPLDSPSLTNALPASTPLTPSNPSRTSTPPTPPGPSHASSPITPSGPPHASTPLTSPGPSHASTQLPPDTTAWLRLPATP